MYFTFMAVFGLITGLYLTAIGLNLYTPRFKREPNAEQLRFLRWSTRLAGPASLIISVVYGLKAAGLV